MNPIDDKTLDRYLSLLAYPPETEDSAALIAQKALAFAQKKNLGMLLKETAADLWHAVFGFADDIALYNSKWRLAGAFAALMIGVSAGYYGWTSADDEMASIYSMDQSEGMDTI